MKLTGNGSQRLFAGVALALPLACWSPALAENSVEFDLPANKTVTLEVTSDCSKDYERYKNDPQPYPKEGYYYKTILTLSNGIKMEVQTPSPAVSGEIVYGGPLTFPTGSGVHVVVEVFEAPVVAGSPGTFQAIGYTRPKVRHVKLDKTKGTWVVQAEGHPGGTGDWDDTVVRFSGL